MNTETRTRFVGPAAASLLGLALVLAPTTALANETDVTRGTSGGIVRFVPNDLDPRGHHVVRIVVPDDGAPAASASGRNAPPQIEAGRAPGAAVAKPRLVPNDLDPRGHHQVPAPPRSAESPQPSDTSAPTPRSFPGDVDPRGLHGLSRWEQMLYQPRLQVSLHAR